MKGWIFTTQENLSYETKRLIECFEKEGVECFAVHPNHVDIFISKENRSSNLLFLLGLVIGPLGYLYFTKIPVNFEITNSYILVIIAGFLVGLGTRMGGGCTSGHGICGISRFSFRSIIATITFIISGVITVLILQQFGFYL